MNPQIIMFIWEQAVALLLLNWHRKGVRALTRLWMLAYLSAALA